jgi:hypothetical protein
MRKCVEEAEKAKSYESRAEYWASKTDEVNLSMPESIDYYAHKLEEAQRHHQDLKTYPSKRSHSMSLQYANKAAKEAEKNLEIAKKLWAFAPQPLEVVVTLANGDTITTRINATLEEARAYYLGHEFVSEGPEFLAVTVEEVGK